MTNIMENLVANVMTSVMTFITKTVMANTSIIIHNKKRNDVL